MTTKLVLFDTILREKQTQNAPFLTNSTTMAGLRPLEKDKFGPDKLEYIFENLEENISYKFHPKSRRGRLSSREKDKMPFLLLYILNQSSDWDISGRTLNCKNQKFDHLKLRFVPYL